MHGRRWRAGRESIFGVNADDIAINAHATVCFAALDQVSGFGQQYFVVANETQIRPGQPMTNRNFADGRARQCVGKQVGLGPPTASRPCQKSKSVDNEPALRRKANGDAVARKFPEINARAIPPRATPVGSTNPDGQNAFPAAPISNQLRSPGLLR